MPPVSSFPYVYAYYLQGDLEKIEQIIFPRISIDDRLYITIRIVFNNTHTVCVIENNSNCIDMNYSAWQV